MAILPKPEMYPDWQSWANSVVQQLENTEPEVQDRAVSTKFPAAEAKFNLGRIVYTVDQKLLKYSDGAAWQTLTSKTYVDQVVNDRLVTGTTSGSNSVLIDPTIPILAYAAGMEVAWVQATTNTGAVQINVSSKGLKDLRRANGAPLQTGVLRAGSGYRAWYDGTLFRLVEPGTGWQTIYIDGPYSGGIKVFALDNTYYSDFRFYIRQVSKNIGNNYLAFQTSTDNNVSYHDGASDYTYAAPFANNTGGFGAYAASTNAVIGGGGYPDDARSLVEFTLFPGGASAPMLYQGGDIDINNTPAVQRALWGGMAGFNGLATHIRIFANPTTNNNWSYQQLEIQGLMK